MVVRPLKERDVRKLHGLLVKSRVQGGLSSFDISTMMRTLKKEYPNVGSISKTEVIKLAWDVIEERGMGDRNDVQANLNPEVGR